MKKLMMYLVFLMALMAVLGSCATTKTPMPTDNIDELVGTWVNPDNNRSVNIYCYGKYEFLQDGTLNGYCESDSEYSSWSVIVDVEKKWKDNKGYVYFETKSLHPTEGKIGAYCLYRVHQEDNTLEMMLSTQDIGKDLKWDTSAGANNIPSYWIWYRK